MDKLPVYYYEYSKKQLREALLKQMNDNIFIVGENHSLNKLQLQTKKELEKTEQHLQSAEKALIYKDEVIEKYKLLLEHSVENL